MNNNSIAVIDGDSICYICSKDSIEDSIKNVKSLIDTILLRTKADGYYMFLSEGTYFRHIINKEYKGKRVTSSLKYIRTLKAYLKEEFKAFSIKNVEADDLVSFMMYNHNEKNNLIMCAIDKDVIKQVKGRYFNYKHHEFGQTKSEEADKFIWLQSLTGKLLPEPLKFGEA